MFVIRSSLQPGRHARRRCLLKRDKCPQTCDLTPQVLHAAVRDAKFSSHGTLTTR